MPVVNDGRYDAMSDGNSSIITNHKDGLADEPWPTMMIVNDEPTS